MQEVFVAWSKNALFNILKRNIKNLLLIKKEQDNEKSTEAPFLLESYCLVEENG